MAWDRADDRTLRLAAPEVTLGELEAFLKYQLALAREAKAQGGLDGAARLSRAHGVALVESRLAPARLEAVRSVVRRYAGNRLTCQELDAARRALVEQASPLGTGPDAPAERLRRLEKELERLEQELRRRDRPETVALLALHEDALLALHLELGRFG